MYIYLSTYIYSTYYKYKYIIYQNNIYEIFISINYIITTILFLDK